MSAASPATAQVRRSAPPPRQTSAVQQPATQAMRPAPAFAFSAVEEDEIRINLGDIPRASLGIDSMHVEGFKPSLLSRLFDLFGSKR